MKEFNINDYIKVKLTGLGVSIHTEHYLKYLKDCHMFRYAELTPYVDSEGYTKYQLWEFMNIFGEYMYTGSDQVIEKNLIYFC